MDYSAYERKDGKIIFLTDDQQDILRKGMIAAENSRNAARRGIISNELNGWMI